VSSGVNILKFDDSQGNNPITQEFYRAADEDSAGFNTTSNACQLTKTANGTIGYTSGLPCFTNPTWSLKVSTTNIIPDAALVYGASTSTTDNNCVTFADGDVATAPSALTYNDLPSSTNSNVQQGDDFSNHVITGLSTRADQYRAINMRLTGGPAMTAKSVHGDSSATEVGVDSGEGNKIYYFYDQPSNSSSLLAVFENDLYNTIHTSNTAGVRVQDPDTDGNAEDTPADAVSSYGDWSQQFGNASSSSLSLKAQDAITAPKLATGTTNLLRCAHDVTDYTATTNFFAATPSNFSTRTGSNAQYVTYAFPCNQTIASFTLKFKGDLDGGGDLWFKMFDSAATNSVETTNSSTGGWVPATVAYAGAGIAGAGGTGCAAGGNLSKTTTSLQTITITAGSGRWNNGSDGKVYVRIKLTAGDYVEQLGLLEI